jgi:hypothetical protein
MSLFSPILIPVVRFSAFCLTEYHQNYNPNRRRQETSDNPAKNFADKPYSYFGKSSKKNLNNRLSNWLDTIRMATQQFKYRKVPYITQHTFATLTLSAKQIHCDKVIKREMLNHFLIEMKRQFLTNNYLWKAEPQENGNIHFHILLDKYIPWEDLRFIWNKAQERLGYISEFEKKYGHRDPNSTDIHALYEVRNVHAYIMKYMKKDKSSRPICGVSWSSSDAIANLQPFQLEVSTELYTWLRSQERENNPSCYSSDFAYIMKFKDPLNLRTLPAFHQNSLRAIVTQNLRTLQHR